MASAIHHSLREADVFEFYAKKGGTKNVDDMLHYIWKFETPRLKWTPSLKNEHTADRLRIEGHCFYRKRKLTKALEMYNLSIMKAPHPVVRDPVSHEGREAFLANAGDRFRIPDVDPSRYGGKTDGGKTRALGLGFVARSTILFDLQLYKECLRNIYLAIEYGCPEEAHSTLHARKERCITALLTRKGKCSEGTPSEAHSLDPEDEELAGEIAASRRRYETPVLAESNPRIPSLSSALRVTHVEGKGRSIFATRDIKPGEVIGVDRAYACYIDDLEMVPTTCSTCLYKTLLPLPCPGCPHVVFCSKACRARGLAEDHWLECKIMTPMTKERAKIMIGAYKMLKTLDDPEFRRVTSALRNEAASYSSSSPEHLKGFSPRGTYSSNSYRSLHHLHYNLDTHSPERLFGLCLAASRVARVIEGSGRYFVNALGEAVTPTKEDLVSLSRTLVVNADKLYKNTFECGAWGRKAGCSGIFPSVSFFNHSCNPSVGYRHRGRNMTMYAQLPIKAGEEATIAYTDGYYFAGREDRRDYLMDYGFLCQCRSCEEDWDAIVDLPFIRLRCLRCEETAPDGAALCSGCSEVSGKAKEQKGEAPLRCFRCGGPAPPDEEIIVCPDCGWLTGKAKKQEDDDRVTPPEDAGWRKTGLRYSRCGKPAPDEAMVCLDSCKTFRRAKKGKAGLTGLLVSKKTEAEMESVLKLLRESPGSLLQANAGSDRDFGRLCRAIELLHGHMATPCEAIWMLLTALESWF